MATKLDISQLDFDGIKDNLKTFLSQQDEFTDYDFEGSGMNILLDVLAYNTHYLGYYANMLANEMYLDSADQRSSVVSLAKQVGYTPKSATASQATINVLLNNATGTSVTMSRGTKFTTTVNSQSYTFVNNADVSISPIDGVYSFDSVTLYEGSLLTFKYTVDTTDTEQRFIIPNDNNNVDNYLGTVSHKSKKFNYICDINPCKLTSITGKITDMNNQPIFHGTNTATTKLYTYACISAWPAPGSGMGLSGCLRSTISPKARTSSLRPLSKRPGNRVPCPSSAAVTRQQPSPKPARLNE